MVMHPPVYRNASKRLPRRSNGAKRKNLGSQQAARQGNRINVESSGHVAECRFKCLGGTERRCTLTVGIGARRSARARIPSCPSWLLPPGCTGRACSHCQAIDTDVSPYEWQTVASRLTWSMGNAVVERSPDARQQILEVVAKAWKEDPDILNIVNGNVISYKSENLFPCMTLSSTVCRRRISRLIADRLSARMFMPTYVTGLDAETGQGSRGCPLHYGARRSKWKWISRPVEWRF